MRWPGGGLTGVEEAATTLKSGADPAMFATLSAFQEDQQRTSNQLRALAERTENHASAAERTVMELEARRDQAEAHYAGLIEQLEEQRDEQLLALDKIVEDAEERINILRGVEVGVFAIDESLAMLNDTLIGEAQARQELAQAKQIEITEKLNENVTELIRETKQQNEKVIRLERDQRDLLASINGNTA